MASVEVNLASMTGGVANGVSQEATSNAAGLYAFSQKQRGTNHMTASKNITAGESDSVISSADALAALKIAVGINPNADPDGAGPEEALPVSPYQFIAADITGDGRVTSADALAILKIAVKLATAEPRRWVFIAEDYDFWDEESGNFKTTRTDVAWDSDGMTFDYPEKSVQNVVGVLMGDVNGSWSAPEGSGAIADSHLAGLVEQGGPLEGSSLAQWGLTDAAESDGENTDGGDSSENGSTNSDTSTDVSAPFANLTGIYIDPSAQVDSPGGGDNHNHLIIAPSGSHAYFEYDTQDSDFVNFCFGQLAQGPLVSQINSNLRCKEAQMLDGLVTESQAIVDYSFSGSFVSNSRIDFTSGSLIVEEATGDLAGSVGQSIFMPAGESDAYVFSENSPIPVAADTNMALNDASFNTLEVDPNNNVLSTTLKPGYYYETWGAENTADLFIIEINAGGTIKHATISNPASSYGDDGSYGCKMDGKVERYPISDVVAQTVMIMDATVSVADCDGDWASDYPDEQFWHLGNYSNRSAVIEPFRYAPFTKLAGVETSSASFWLISSDENGNPKFYEFSQFCLSDGTIDNALQPSDYQCEYQNESGIYQPVLK